jgi:hypothetical protein
MDEQRVSTVDWSLVTHDGLRLHRHRQFLALPFMEKLKRLEEMCEVARWFETRRREREKLAGQGKAS